MLTYDGALTKVFETKRSFFEGVCTILAKRQKNVALTYDGALTNPFGSKLATRQRNVALTYDGALTKVKKFTNWSKF